MQCREVWRREEKGRVCKRVQKSGVKWDEVQREVINASMATNYVITR